MTSQFKIFEKLQLSGLIMSFGMKRSLEGRED